MVDMGVSTPNASTLTQSADGSTSTATDPSSKPYNRSRRLAAFRWTQIALAWVLKNPVVTKSSAEGHRQRPAR
jgi:hypothetical protein